MDGPSGLCPISLTWHQYQDVGHVYREWCEGGVSSSYLLQLKTNGKELDPRYFDEKEKRAFEASDAKEWLQWHLNEAVRVVPHSEEKQVPKNLIFSAPMRMLRVNRGTTGDLIAKSRMIAPGHCDPQLGLYRTDSPTTSLLGLFVVVVVGISKGWLGEIFDVTAAFLSGLKLERKAYIRGPREGIPPVNYRGKVYPGLDPYQLLEMLKGAYGFTEACRLWYLQARELLIAIGFVELLIVRAVFVLRDGSLLVGVLALHVDDGMLFGDMRNHLFQKARRELDKKFNIKAWRILSSQKDEMFLGMEWRLGEDMVVIHMNAYVMGLVAIGVGGCQDTGDFTESQQHEYKSGLAKLRWPVNRVLPRLAYKVSYLSQKKETDLNIACVKMLNDTIQEAKDMVMRNQGQIVLRPIDLEDLVVVTSFDAGFAGEEGRKMPKWFCEYRFHQCSLQAADYMQSC